uniref:Uncharacterized protein n=1 Tax=Photinus pyralis TaxID=7054 RepID=A0A1Y1MTH2_PHOPY
MSNVTAMGTYARPFAKKDLPYLAWVTRTPDRRQQMRFNWLMKLIQNTRAELDEERSKKYWNFKKTEIPQPWDDIVEAQDDIMGSSEVPDILKALTKLQRAQFSKSL